MDGPNLVGLLALVTLVAGVAIAVISKRKVEARKEDPEAPKSTLAKDESSHAKPADV